MTARGLAQGRADHQIELPAGAQLWTVRVANEPVKPTVVPAAGGTVNDRLLRIPLIKTAAGDLDYLVQIKYGGQLGALARAVGERIVPGCQAAGGVECDEECEVEGADPRAWIGVAGDLG